MISASIREVQKRQKGAHNIAKRDKHQHKEEANMKKLVAVALVAGLAVLGSVKLSRAVDITVSADVGNVFALTYTGGAIDLGAGSPVGVGAGEIANSLSFSVTTNKGTNWVLKIAGYKPELADLSAQLPTFKYKISGDATKGTYTPDNGTTAADIPVPGSAATIFTSNAAGNVAEGLGFGMWLLSSTASNQKAGHYSTTLYLTLEDAA